MAYRVPIDALRAEFLALVALRDELPRGAEGQPDSFASQRSELERQIEATAARIDDFTPGSAVAQPMRPPRSERLLVASLVGASLLILGIGWLVVHPLARSDRQSPQLSTLDWL